MENRIHKVKMAEVKLAEAKMALDTLTVYRKLMDEPVIRKFYLLLTRLNEDGMNYDSFIPYYCDFYAALLEESAECSWSGLLLDRIVYTENAFSSACETAPLHKVSPAVLQAVKHDLTGLEYAAALTSCLMKEHVLHSCALTEKESEIIRRLPEWKTAVDFCADNSIFACFAAKNSWMECTEELADFYHKNGAGSFARYCAFTWQTKGLRRELTGIPFPDPICFRDLIGYETPRQKVIDNTLMFLKGYAANNVLLYGDRGTGKSSTVKALLNEYKHLGLRMIELPLPYLDELPQILRIVRDKPQKFIIFIDDLAFSDSEETYTALKAVLEGGLESRPDNVVIYATSNRRHLIKERFSERSGLYSGNTEDEVRAAETIQEKLSLADRFGITVTFLSPDQHKYLEIVDGLAAQRGIRMRQDILHQEAIKWEMRQNGRSPRTARQFIDWLQAQPE